MFIVLPRVKTGFVILICMFGIIIFPSVSVLSAGKQISGQDSILLSEFSSQADNSNLVFNRNNFSSIIYTENQSKGFLAGVYWGDRALAAVVIKNTTTTQCGNNRIGVIIAYRQLVGVAKIFSDGYLIKQQPIYNIRMNYFYLGSLLEFVDNNADGLFNPAEDTVLKCANLTNLSWKISFSNSTIISLNPTTLGTISISATNTSYDSNLNSNISGNTTNSTNYNKKINLIQFTFTLNATANPINKNNYTIYPVDFNRGVNQITAVRSPTDVSANISGFDLGFNVKMNQKIIGWNFSNSNTNLVFPVNLGVIDIMSPFLPKLSVILHTVFLRDDAGVLGRKTSIQKNNMFEYQFQSTIRKTFRSSFGQTISFQSNTNNESINDSTSGTITSKIIKPRIVMKNFWDQNILAKQNTFNWIDNGSFDNNIQLIKFQINTANITKEAIQYDTNQQLALINMLELQGNFIYPQGKTIIIDPSMQTVGVVLQFPSIQSQTFNIKNTLEFAPIFLLGFSIILTVIVVVIHFKRP